MRVKVAKRMYQMEKKEFRELLKIASDQVPFGIYAVEKNGYAELLNLKCQSITKLKQHIREFKSAGWKVYQNGR